MTRIIAGPQDCGVEQKCAARAPVELEETFSRNVKRQNRQ